MIELNFSSRQSRRKNMVRNMGWQSRGKNIVRKSDFTRWRNYANTVARPALRRANVVEEPQLHAGCCSHARAGHRSEHGDFQRRQRRAAEPAALCEAGSADHDLDKAGEDRVGAELGVGTGSARFPPAVEAFRELRGDLLTQCQSDWRR